MFFHGKLPQVKPMSRWLETNFQIQDKPRSIKPFGSAYKINRNLFIRKCIT